MEPPRRLGRRAERRESDLIADEPVAVLDGIPDGTHNELDAHCRAGAPRGVKAQAYTARATALVAPAVETLGDGAYCRRFRHARRPTRPVPKSSSEAGSGTGSGAG